MQHGRQTVGIVGGLCPLATADIYLKAMRQVKARNGDADYPDIIINAAVEQECRGNTFDNLRNYDMSHRVLYVYQVAAELKRQRVDRILVPDFLTHSSISSISRNIQTPVIDIVAVVIGRIRRTWPEARTIGLLTTSTAIRNQVFERQFAEAGLHIVHPDDGVQETMVMEAIYGAEGIKRGHTSGRPGELIGKACAHLLAKGAEVIATAVTELPLIERRYYPQDRYLDCNEAIGLDLVEAGCAAPAAPERRTIVGILGGLGPAATVDIFDKIVRHTPASRDQEHLKIIIENNPQIPDRTAALSGQGEDPSVALLASAEKLKIAGADFIIVPCNTAHAFLRSVQQHVGIPILSMIEETVRHITGKHASVRTVGLLATSGTIGSKVYEEPFAKAGIRLLVPPADAQRTLVMEAIYGPGGIKAGHVSGLPRAQLLAAAQGLIAEGAQVIVLGCTEIPLVLGDGDTPVPCVDPTDVLAQAAVEHAMCRTTPGRIA